MATKNMEAFFEKKAFFSAHISKAKKINKMGDTISDIYLKGRGKFLGNVKGKNIKRENKMNLYFHGI